MDILTFLKSFKPHNAPIPLAEKIRSSLVAGTAIFLLGFALQFLPHNIYPLFMLASMAASATILFALPHSPMAQPWSLVGGHLVSAIAAWLCILYIPDPLLAAGVGVGAAIFIMHLLNCLHPPGAATALILALHGEQFLGMGWKGWLLVVAVNALVSLLLALAINNLLPGRKYPMRQLQQQASKPGPFISLEHSDLEWALSQMDGVIDVSEDDLSRIYELALRHAQERNDAEINK